jgi:hypothetical protein
MSADLPLIGRMGFVCWAHRVRASPPYCFPASYPVLRPCCHPYRPMDVPLPLIDDLEPVVGAALGLEELAAGSPLVEPRPLGLPWANAKEAVPNKMLSVIAACLMTFPLVCKNELFSLWKVPCPIEVGHDADDYVRRAPVPHRDCRVDAGGQRSARRYRGDASASLRRSADG